jgi:site-specific DNA recombinase
VLQVLRRGGIAAELARRDGAADAAAFDALRSRREALTARQAELARMFAAGDIDAAQLKSGTAELRGQVTELDRVLAAQKAVGPAARLAEGGPDGLEARWAALSPDLRGKVVDQLMVVRVLPTGGAKGVDRDGVVDPAYLDVAPKVAV